MSSREDAPRQTVLLLQNLYSHKTLQEECRKEDMGKLKSAIADSKELAPRVARLELRESLRQALQFVAPALLL